MITVYNTTSSFFWYPAKFEMVGGQSESFYEKLYFNNGIEFNAHKFLYEAMDFVHNRNTSLLLTDLLSAGELFQNKDKPENSRDFTQITSVLSDKNGFVFAVSSVDVRINNKIYKRKVLARTTRTNLLPDDYLNFIVDENDKNLIYIEDPKSKLVLTDRFNYVPDYNRPIDLPRCIFSTRIRPANNTQRFEYYLSDNGEVCLFRAGSSVYKNRLALAVNSVNTLDLSSVDLPRVDKVSENITFKFNSYKKELVNFNSVVNSRIVKYNSTPIDRIESLKIDSNLAKTPYQQNFLIMFPGENPQIFDDEAIYSIQALGLKNYQTPYYDYSIGPAYAQENDAIRRIYYQIYTGTNQEKGYDQIYLGYTSNTSKLYFEPDKETEFYFTPDALRLPLSACGLIESGSIASDYPYTSDRIFARMQNYQNILPGLPQPPSMIRETGTWLCSWLSGSNTGKKIWVDRFYNAGYYSIKDALTAGTMTFNPVIDPTKPYVYDLPSTMYMEPGALYKYFRSGTQTAKQFLNYLNYTSETNRGSLILHISSWNENPIKDISKYKNNGLIVNSLDSQFNIDYYTLDGTNHVIFPAKSEFFEMQRFTVGIWLNPDDWSKLEGNQIVGNYYDGGWGLINETAQTAPLLTMSGYKLGSNLTRTYTINYRGGLADSFEVKTNLKNRYFKFMQRLQNLEYWSIDSNNLKLYKFDINGKIIINDLGVLDAYIKQVDQFEIDSNEYLYIYDKSKFRVLVLKPDGTYHRLIGNIRSARIELDFYNDVIQTEAEASVIDNNNDLWEIIGGNLYTRLYQENTKTFGERKIVANIGSCQQITCDSKNNIWIITKLNRLIKYNTSTFVFEVDKQLTDDYIDVCDFPQEQFTHLNFFRVPGKEDKNVCGEAQPFFDIIAALDTLYYKLYLFDERGILLSRIDIRSYIADEDIRFSRDWVFGCFGDYTGYQYIRKYSNPDKKLLSWKFKTIQPNTGVTQLHTLSYLVSSLPPGWHHFSLTFDALEGTAKYYIDSILVSTQTFAKDRNFYYAYKSPIFLGATTVKNTSLNDVINVQDSYKFIGNVADLRFYTKSLTKGEIEQLYFSSKYSIDRGPLSWNLITGERNFVEKIEHLFKFQMPGSKSNYYNINIHNFTASEELKQIIEEAVKNNLQKIAPSNTFLNKINWL
jgi:hypothetical protein